MAITPRSFLLNPKLTAAALIAVFAGAAFFTCGTDQDCSLRQSEPSLVRYGDCSPASTEPARWTVEAWQTSIHCLLENDRGEEAYRVAREAVRHYPRSATLLNLKGFVAGRNGDHAVAAYDFRAGLHMTGSPTGVFENNIAWTLLWKVERYHDAHKERALQQARNLYVRSLDKGWSCERVHTGMFTEYAIANHTSRISEDGRKDPRVVEAVERYKALYRQYKPCERRLRHGDELVVEELMSAAVIDQEMGYIAGVRRPTRHMTLFDDAVGMGERLGLDGDELCETSIPVADAVPACEALLR